MTIAALIDGRPHAELGVWDRGLHYGDGVFETIAVYAGTLPLWPRHRDRLLRGCARLGIAGVDPELLYAEAAALAQGRERAVIKLIVTRGAGGRGYRPPAPAEAPPPTRVLLRYPWPDYPERWRDEGVAVRVCTTRLSNNPLLAGIKHLNRLEQVLARREWYDPAIAEGLMCDQAGQLVEATQSNVFVVREGRLLTPPLVDAGVEGVMRGLVIEQAPAWCGLAVEESVLALADLARADEIFLSNAVAGIWPVCRVDAGRVPVGPVTRNLVTGLRGLQDAWMNGVRGAHA